MITTLDIVSIGKLSCDVQASVARVREALEQLNIQPTMRINGIDHYSAGVADRLFPLLSQPPKESR